MKICVFGNSHASTLQMALKDGWHVEDTTIDFAVISGGRGPYMKLEDDLVFPTRNIQNFRTTLESAASEGVRINDFDAIILSGIGVRLLGFGKSTEAHFPLHRARLATWGGSHDLPRITRQHMQSVMEGAITAAPLWQLCEALLARGGARIFLHTAPRPARGAIKALGHPLMNDYSEEAVAAHLSEILDTIDKARRAITADLPVDLLSLPNDIVIGGFTNEALMRRDFVHGAAPLGRMVLDNLVASLKQAA